MPESRFKRHLLKDRSTQVRILLSISFVIITSLILPKSFVPEYSYEVGKRWVYPDLTAEFDFQKYKNPTAIERERADARARVNPVFREDTAKTGVVRQKVDDAITQFFTYLTEYKRLLMRNNDTAQVIRNDIFQEKYLIAPDPLIVRHLSLANWEESFRKKVDLLVSEIYERGFTDKEKTEIGKDDILIQVSPTLAYKAEKASLVTPSELDGLIPEIVPHLEEDELKLVDRIIAPELTPTLLFSQKLTDERIQEAEKRVSPVYGMVRTGEIIIKNGQMIGEEQDVLLKSYFSDRSKRYDDSNFLQTWLGQLVVFGIISFIMLLFLRLNVPLLYFRNRKLGLILLVNFTMMVVVMLILKLTMFTNDAFEINYIFLAPLCMVPIILNAFFDSRTAFFSNIIIALFAGSIVQNGFEVFFIQLCAGTISVYSLERLRNRADFFISLSLIFLTYVVAYLGYSFYAKGGIANIQYANLILFGLNVVLTLITYPLIYLFERVFGLTSDLTYVELLDTNHPLLKELAIKAPGTFQHSLQVANIAEAVLNKIGGNSLQTKVGAYFHDIGKMAHPQFFIENQGDEGNPHDTMPYEESAHVIIQHVIDGVKMAQEHNLPNEIINFIKTHHGTSRTEYFYRKWCLDHPDQVPPEGMFNYPGPLPYTREMAVLMIADSVEAASRSLKDKSHESIIKLVNGIVDQKVASGQFSNANLTFKDLEDTKHVILNQLMSIYHGRIEYPKEPVFRLR